MVQVEAVVDTMVEAVAPQLVVEVVADPDT
jgi:hypothetical protein